MELANLRTAVAKVVKHVVGYFKRVSKFHKQLLSCI